MAATQFIDLTDLRNPERSALQKMVLAATARRPVTLTRAAVLDAARAQTGLDDFGAEDFLPRLDCWMQAVEEDANASTVARTNVYQLAVRCAANRLRLEDFIRRHPQVSEVRIEKPIVVAGTPRSGTTFMLELLGANPRRTRAAANWRSIEALLPHQKLMHAFSADHIAEDIDLHVMNFSSYMLEWDAYVPRWRDYYLAEDQRSTYAYAKRAMQVLSYLHGPTRWVLKCPQHMEQLAVLNDVFPDATFVLTHRDPVGSIRSAMVMALYSARIFRQVVDPAEPLAYWPDRYERMLRACVRDRDGLPADRTLDVYFDEWIGNPDAVLREIYRRAELPITDAQLRQMHASSAEHHQRSSEKLVYDLERDFGVTASELRARFGFYFDRFPVRAEVA
jgi:hypothetical protein